SAARPSSRPWQASEDPIGRPREDPIGRPQADQIGRSLTALLTARASAHRPAVPDSRRADALLAARASTPGRTTPAPHLPLRRAPYRRRPPCPRPPRASSPSLVAEGDLGELFGE